MKNAAEILRIAMAIAETVEPSQSPEAPSPERNNFDGLPETVLIRTVTHYHVGRIVSVNDRYIELSEAAWVASTGRFNEALVSGVLDEVEPFVGNVWVAVGSVVDVTEWTHPLPNRAR